MNWLNYHHLLYFWMVAREGSITRACELLHLAQPTVSSQIQALERSLGTQLFRRSGRSLVLTDCGQLVFQYADEIFNLGSELVETLKSRPEGRPVKLTVGIADVVPKLVAYRLLASAVNDHAVNLVCREGKPDRLFAELAVHGLDLVISDSPLNPEIQIKGSSDLLCECGTALFGTPTLAQRYAEGFPASLNGAPLLLPTRASSLRRDLDQWFEDQAIRPLIRGEFEDSALLKVFAQAGLGLFFAPLVTSTEIQRQFGIMLVAQIPTIRERYYAISVQRRLQHPAVAAIRQSARASIDRVNSLSDPPGSIQPGV